MYSYTLYSSPCLSWLLLGQVWEGCGTPVSRPSLTPVSWCHRRLTDRQRALMMSYAEDEADVDGTVNGVTNTASGERGESLPLPWGAAVAVQSAS